MSDTPTEAERQILRSAMSVYRTEESRAGVRGGMSDAAHLLDAIAKDIANQHRVRGKLTKRGVALSLAVSRAADAIWEMREKVTFDDVRPAPAITDKEEGR